MNKSEFPVDIYLTFRYYQPQRRERRGTNVTDTIDGEGNAFGRRVRELREARRRDDPEFSLRQFAQRAGISPTFLSKIETGDLAPPIPAKIVRIAELLGTNTDELLALAGKVSPEVTDMINERPKTHVAFLRKVRLLPDARLRDVERLLDDMNAPPFPDGNGGA